MKRHFASDNRPMVSSQESQARNTETDSSNTSEELMLRSSQRVESNFASTFSKIAKFLYDRKLRDAFESLKLMNQKQVQILITEVDSNERPSERGLLLANAIDCLTELGGYGDILNICKAYGELSLTDYEHIEVNCHIGWALLSISRNREALSMFQKSKKLLSTILVFEYSNWTLKATVGYAYTLSELGDNKNSYQHLKLVIKELDKDFPEDQITLKAKLYQAIVLSRLGKYPSALELCTKICKKQQEFEPDSLLTVEAEYHLALFKFNMNNFDEARLAFDDVNKACTRLNLKRHPIYIRTCYKIAQTDSSLGRNTDALEKLKDVKQRLISREDEDFLKIQRLEAQILSRLGQYDQAAKAYTTLHKKQEKLFGIEHPSTLETIYQMGINLLYLKNYMDSLLTLQHVEKLQKKNLGDDHLTTLRTRSQIAAVCCEMGRYSPSKVTLDSVIEAQRNQLPISDPDILRSRRFLAQYLAKTGKFEQAEKLLEEIRPLQVKNSGEDHPSTLETGFQLGVTRKLANKFDEALSLLESVHGRQSKKLGVNHPLTLITQTEIAIIHSEKGDQQKASDLLITLISLLKSGDQSQWPPLDLLTARGYYGKVLSRMDQQPKAIDVLTDVEKQRALLLGSEHPVTLETKYQIGLVRLEMCEYDEAHNLLHITDRSQSKVLGKLHPATLRTKTDLARVLSDKGSNDKSLEIFNEIQPYFDQNTSGFNIDMLRTQRYRVRTQYRLGHYEHALTKLEDVERGQTTMLKPEHPSLLETKYQIGQIYKVLGKPTLALNTFEEILKVQKKGTSEAMTLRTQVSIASILVSMEEPKDSIQMLNKLVENCETKLSANHCITLTAKRYKAQALSKCGEFEAAVKLFDIVWSSQRQKLSSHHPQTLETIIQYGICQETMGLTQQAIEKYEYVLKIRENDLGLKHPNTIIVLNLLKISKLPTEVEAKSESESGSHFAQAKRVRRNSL